MWGKYLSLFGISMIKFMFAPFGGVPLNMTYTETYLACVSGALLSAVFFFFMSSFFMDRAEKKRKRKRLEAIQKGIALPKTKNFTFMNKMIVKVKHALGIYGVCLWAPFFFSIPIGSIISAKFYGHDKRAFPLITLGIFLNGLITTTLAYSKQLFE